MVLRASGDDALEHVGQPCHGSTPFNFADWINVATIAQLRVPLSLPANKAFFLVSTTERMARSTVFVSNSRRPSSKKRIGPAQRLSESIAPRSGELQL